MLLGPRPPPDTVYLADNEYDGHWRVTFVTCALMLGVQVHLLSPGAHRSEHLLTFSHATAEGAHSSLLLDDAGLRSQGTAEDEAACSVTDSSASSSATSNDGDRDQTDIAGSKRCVHSFVNHGPIQEREPSAATAYHDASGRAPLTEAPNGSSE
ncbi:hypothetical protein NDU88_003087 [Pleurodeles waltl]|uniref:Uncharacterized protein n=1 Tax=Pleurodeles waltl TaxID=8319 RepID=A0AAV7M2F2_PLEWA|nr:hypothetical protein NDU88_003087 [Pleurodeles waltl]